MQDQTAHSSVEAVFNAAIHDGYLLLSEMLHRAPTPFYLSRLRRAEWHPDAPGQLIAALGEVCRAAAIYPSHSVEREFRALFSARAQGEVVPHASWYLRHSMRPSPLACLRSDLADVGILRRHEVPEAEDHAALLCGAMALLRQDPEISPEEYAYFLHEHVTSWMFDFFVDLFTAPSAGFYKSVAMLGQCLLQLDHAAVGRSAKQDHSPGLDLL